MTTRKCHIMTLSTGMPSPATRLVLATVGRAPPDCARFHLPMGVSGSPSGGGPPPLPPSPIRRSKVGAAYVDWDAASVQTRLSVRMRIHQRFNLNRGMKSFLLRLIPGIGTQKRTKAPNLPRLGERTWIRGEAPFLPG